MTDYNVDICRYNNGGYLHIINQPNQKTMSEFEHIPFDKTYQPKSYRWEPKEDITAYELAQCLPAPLISIKGLVVQPEIERLPENCRRHFEEE